MPPSTRDWSDDIAEDLLIAVVVSRFNADVTSRMAAICRETLFRYGLPADQLTWVETPGALEIPFVAGVLAANGDVDGIVGLGCVMRGETAHFDIVAQASAAGLMQIQVARQTPVINGILTVDTAEQAEARIEQKAVDAALAVIETVVWRRSIKRSISTVYCS